MFFVLKPLASGTSTSPVKISISRWNSSFSSEAQNEFGSILQVQWLTYVQCYCWKPRRNYLCLHQSLHGSFSPYRHNIGLPAASSQFGAWESKLTDNIQYGHVQELSFPYETRRRHFTDHDGYDGSCSATNHHSHRLRGAVRDASICQESILRKPSSNVEDSLV